MRFYDMRRIYIIFSLIFLIYSIGLYAQGKGAKNSKTSKNIPEGFGNVNWGTLVSAAKGQVLGKIIFSDDKKVIRSRDGDIEYLYGFFYIDPALMKGTPQGGTEGKLFYVSINFPYLLMDDVRKKIEAKYGTASGETIKNNQGALLWDSGKTSIILWADEYEDKPYCRKITYVGREIAKEINEYQKKVFNKRELEILEKLSP
jgi:hypothetical protein